MKQEQFLDVVDERTAHARIEAACAHLAPRSERVALCDALGRVLADDVRAPVDVPGFDRSDVDGFAVRASDTFGAEELAPVRLGIGAVRLAAGTAPPEGFELPARTAVQIATGGVLPRGADAVVMVEHTVMAEPHRIDGGTLAVLHAVAPGAHVAFAGGDLGRGEVALRRGTELTSRETGILAALGVASVDVVVRPRVVVLSTGDELRPPGEPLPPGAIYDANARILADAVREAGAVADERGRVGDDAAALTAALRSLLAERPPPDVIVLSGGTSKGAGDINHTCVAALARDVPSSPGIVVHGVALKPGKPLCFAVVGTCPVVVLPGFPTSAVFTFHEFVAPLLRRLGRRREDAAESVEAAMPVRVPSAIGRTDYTLVNLVPGDRGLAAYPIGAGSGSVSAFARADGFVRIPQDAEFLPEGARVAVRLLGRGLRAADLTVIGSHCTGLDALLGELAGRGFVVKSVVVGSKGGLAALARGEGDVAGTHLLDARTGEYNRAFLPDGAVLVRGWARRQGFVHRRGDPRFEGIGADAFAEAVRRSGVRMVHRNAGSGTRALLDAFLGDARPAGWHHQAKSHHAVAAAVAQGRADWGMTLDVLADASGLAFTFVRDERYDLAVAASRADRPGVRALLDLVASAEGRAILRDAGFRADDGGRA